MNEQKEFPQWWHNNLGNVRAMVVCEGYVMARRPYSAPFVKSIADFKITFKPGKKPEKLNV